MLEIINKIISYLNSNSGLLTFIVTLIYTITTIKILQANKLSADATQAQLETMKTQYANDNKPYITVELIYHKRMYYGLRFTNHGKRIANDVCIVFQQAFIDSLPSDSFKGRLEKERGKKFILGIGQVYDIYIGGNRLRNADNNIPIAGTVTYLDGKEQVEVPFYINFENYSTFFSVNTDTEDLLERLDRLNNELEHISIALKTKEHLYSEKEEIHDEEFDEEIQMFEQSTP